MTDYLAIATAIRVLAVTCVELATILEKPDPTAEDMAKVEAIGKGNLAAFKANVEKGREK